MTLTDQQMTELAALRRALSEGDLDMVAASVEILLGLEVPILPLLDTLGQGIWEEDEDSEELEQMLIDVLRDMDASAIPALATYLMEEEGPDILLDLIAMRLEAFPPKVLLRALSRAAADPDERIREGVRDYLDEMADEIPEASDVLDDIEEELDDL
ncbi:MAG: hypothetical protein Kow0077_12760 [Anaerolineae bacterium]